MPSTNTANAAVWGPCHTPPLTHPLPSFVTFPFFLFPEGVCPRGPCHTQLPHSELPKRRGPSGKALPLQGSFTPGEPDPWKQCPHHGRYGERVINHVWDHLTTQAVPCVIRLPCSLPLLLLTLIQDELMNCWLTIIQFRSKQTCFKHNYCLGPWPRKRKP